MAELKTVRPFLLVLPSGASLQFRRGDRYVPDAFADHPDVLANTVGPDEELPDLGVGTPAHEVDAEVDAEAVAEAADGDDETPEEKAADAALVAAGVSKDALLAQAKDLGLNVNARWGEAKLKEAVDAALAAKQQG